MVLGTEGNFQGASNPRLEKFFSFFFFFVFVNEFSNNLYHQSLAVKAESSWNAVFSG